MTTTSHKNIAKFPTRGKLYSSATLIAPERITEARQAARYTQSDLARRVGVSRQAISAYELGSKTPDPEVLSSLATELNQPLLFFTHKNNCDFGKHSTRFYRKVGADTKKRNQACNVFSHWLSETTYYFSDMVRLPKVDIPQFEPEDSFRNLYSEEEIESIAEQVRFHFGLGFGPISNVIRLLEKHGVIVSRYEMTGENIEAFSFWAGERPFIFLASEKDSAVRARFDAAHELGHLCMHSWVGDEEIQDKDRLKTIEVEANKFAGAFLLPRKSFPNEVYSPRANAFVELKRRWKVAIQAMVHRCKSLDIFDERQIVNLYKQISYKKWRTAEPLDKGPGAIAFEQPALLPRVAELVVESGRKTPDDILRETGLSREVLEDLIGVPRGMLDNHGEIEIFPNLKE